MFDLPSVTRKVLEGHAVTKKEARALYDQPLETLSKTADAVRRHFCSNHFDLCTIINGKCGNCSENCKFCAQSAHYHTGVKQYPLQPEEEILRQAKLNYKQGVKRYSIVTSGKRLSDAEIDQMCRVIERIKTEVGISVCVSFGLLNRSQFARLKEAGVSRVHNNLETSQNFFSHICTTHTFADKVQAIRDAQSVGLSVCSGGIMGLGETVEDRIDMAFSLRELGIQSVPVNLLNPISGTLLAHNPILPKEELERIVAVYRFILPTASIRLAGGRGLLSDKGKGCFCSGANAAISGDMLTTNGITTQTDLTLLAELGYEVTLCNE